MTVDEEHAELDPLIDRRVRATVAGQSMLTTLGVGIYDLAPGRAELELARRADLCQQHGFIHAGAITTLVDSACGFAALTLFPPDRDVLTVDFSLSLVAPASQERFLAVGSVLRNGRTLTTCRGEVFGIAPDGSRKIVALMQATMMAVTTPSG
ncbi:PaaI family thioesterase [Actinomadura sp. DC4]|uniref:PaaI family thioesterase n=1 Tax=Actinomadura sp. DC4 TaxID=3055069 RepID=UPI0025B04047|nr:PaaI family thioesterase [Actinomadura sp. DC4]MDN3357422.1 PaaI family thioesterase [Actinomadura sp. DC4]